MRKLAIGLLAIPVLSVVYLSAVLRRSMAARVGTSIALGAILAVGIVIGMRPTAATATPPSSDIPLTSAAFRTVVATGRGLTQPVTIEFSAPMNEASVAAAVSIAPATAVDLAWDDAGRILTIIPRTHWAAGTYHNITVDAGVLAANGSPMVSAARAAFLTRDSTGATISATGVVGRRVAVDSAFDVTFDQAVDPASVTAGLRLDPAITGTTQHAILPDGTIRYRFTPSTPLAADATYHLIAAGIVDADGLAVPAASLAVRTVAAPEVVRFRPRDATTQVARDAVLSVRFTSAMDHAATAAAFRATVNGAPVVGRIRWAEGDTVLVFDPSSALPYSGKVVMTVAASAEDQAGVPLGTAVNGTFRVVVKPVPAPAATTHKSSGSSGGSAGGGGGAVGGGSWGSVETYYLGLMNCTRTGGWVTSSGACSSPGGRAVAALRLDAGISTHVSRPYAKKLAVGNDCSHFVGGDPGDRLRAAGYTSYRWAENIGCRSGSPRSAVLGSHLFFQNERASNGGHYVNLMNAAYDRVGIGVWVSGGRVRLVVDFYHP